jgi:3-oxoacyl-[acyl-carrier protein] reductase
MQLGLKGKAAVITGGSVGVGLAIAEGLAAEGVDLLLSARDDGRLTREAERIAATYEVRVESVAGDVSTPEAVSAIVDAAEAAFGSVDILINNAGTGSNETIMEAPDGKWDFYWNLHVMAAVRLARGLVPGMKRRGGGVILHNASISPASRWATSQSIPSPKRL